MKNLKFLWSGTVLRAAGILAPALVLAACGNLLTLGNSTITGVTVSPPRAIVAKGGSQVFTATVVGANSPDQSVKWTIDEQVAPGTVIDPGGVLTVAEEETASSLTVRAVSIEDTGKSGTASVSVGTAAVDMLALTAKIAEAKTEWGAVIVAADAAGAARGEKWAAPDQAAALESAIDGAEAALSAATGQADLDAAAGVLEIALGTFRTAVSRNGPGTKIGGFTQKEFNALKIRAIAAGTGVIVSVNGDEVPPSGVWVTRSEWDALESALNTAPVTVSDSSYLALLSAIDTFNAAKKTGGGGGRAENRLTVSGLEGIYRNRTSVYAGVLDDRAINAAVNPAWGTVRDGSLSVSLPGVKGSHYVGFSSDGFAFFISKTKVAFSGGTIGKTYADFELYTWSTKGGGLGVTSPMTLDALIRARSRGGYADYAAFKNAWKWEIADELDEYAGLNFLGGRAGLYKDEACVQEFSGADTVGPDTVIYTKFPLFDIDDDRDDDWRR
jgi:hypothetical protein